MDMQRHRKEVDLWEPYEGLYLTPTKLEREMIEPFLCKFEFEDDEFVEEDDEFWVHYKEMLGRPNLRRELMDFLYKVRESKGYDVDRCFGFFHSPFLALRLELKSVYDRAKAATDVAIEEINQSLSSNGKRYQFVSLERFNRVETKLLLTFTVIETDSTAMEIDDDPNADSCLKTTIQAMVEEPKNMVFHLLEWKFKPPPAIPFRVPYRIKF